MGRTHRHRWLRWTLLLTVGLGVALVGTWAVLFVVVQPPEPGSFYTPPEPLPEGGPGTIIRSEPIRDDLPDHAAEGWRILYRSTDPSGDAIAVSGVLAVPEGEPPEEGRDVVAWAHPTTGVDSRCAPSLRSEVFDSIHGADRFLEAGDVVVATDYPGLGTPGPHPYLVGVSEARAVIDSVRATRDLDEADAGTRYAVWGHSQGAQAALFVGQVAPGYAPDLELAGVAAASPPTDLSTLLELDLDSLAGKLLGSFGLWSWSQLYPDAELSSIVEPSALGAVNELATRCIETPLQTYVLAPQLAWLQTGFLQADPTTTQPWEGIIEDNSPETGAVSVPVLVAQGTDDEIVHPDVTEDYVDDSCDDGTTIDLKLLDGVAHVGAGEAAAPDAARWIADRFAGETAPTTCDDGSN
ncbi:MAG: alpha/beta fold hydrolase [Acidimicrobiia bacterium]|nr:alpha/beta fold hydrolase [Acidimicrobiia bacterium]